MHQPKLHWYKKIWNPAVLPSTSANVWEIARNVCATEENLRKKGFQFASRCYICHDEEDNIEHILWKCDFSTSLWNWLSGIFLSPKPNHFEDVLKMHKNSSPVIKELWIISSYTVMVELWFLRNAIYYDAEKPVLTKIQLRIARKVHDCEVRLKGVMWGTDIEKSILRFFNIQRKSRQCRLWFFSKESCWSIFAESGGLGITTNYVAEFISCIKDLEWAVEHLSFELVLQSDSSMCAKALQQKNIPWFLLARWQRIMASIHSITFKHAYRESISQLITLLGRGHICRMGRL
ncbi:uncharacterized protein LOC113359187 [Papaver somniferum]|uniref:uncharacterized protein LOC113359187 n=1 Tax=Papaver somniferum TaxID=3469 RepID=UPI000E6FB076|nr:uncharacterized protein LOC113359187 [Papaver somniferum]